MTNTTTKPGKTNDAARAEALSEGTAKHFPDPTQKVMVGGETLAITEVGANLKEIVTLRTSTTDAQASAKTKVATEKKLLPPLLLFMAAYTAFVKATFGNTPDVLADFGLAPKKAPTPLTTEQKAAAKAKRDATRKARGTTGSVKKKAIVGNVVGVTVTPVTSPAAAPSAQPPQPAPATPATAPGPTAGGASGTSGGGTTPHTA